MENNPCRNHKPENNNKEIIHLVLFLLLLILIILLINKSANTAAVSAPDFEETLARIQSI